MFCRTVRIPLQINTPRFLVRIGNKLGRLSINGKDLSVRFPDAFNNAIKGLCFLLLPYFVKVRFKIVVFLVKKSMNIMVWISLIVGLQIVVVFSLFLVFSGGCDKMPAAEWVKVWPRSCFESHQRQC